jgi:hypothetical protein
LQDPPISPAAVKKLFAQIPFASSEVDPSVFEVDELWRQIEENEEQIRNGSLQGMKPVSAVTNLRAGFQYLSIGRVSSVKTEYRCTG